MPEKEFIDFLGTSALDRIRCWFKTEKGEVIEILVVQYETFINDQWLPVVRYDTSHGFFHRDLYDATGREYKERLDMNLSEALTFAIRDIRKNWKTYKSRLQGEQS